MSTTTMSTAFDFIDEVVEANLCIGCGACASVAGSDTEMRINEKGIYQPSAKPTTSVKIKLAESQVCPFNSHTTETDISQRLFPNSNTHKIIGKYLEVYAGFVQNPDERAKSSSGGIGTWILEELLTRNLIDGVAHISSATDNNLFKYKISRTIAEVKAARKTKYYATEISEVISEIRKTPGRYAITGVPCYIKAIQLLRDNDPVLKERIVFTIGLVCGHMKTHAYTEWLAWEAGVVPGELISIDYRHKNLDQPANNYSTLVEQNSGASIIKNSDLPLNKWGYGLFKPNACEYCDDVFAETADISIGDAWLPQYVSDPLGTNIVIIRNLDIMNIFHDLNSSSNKLHLERINPDTAWASQLGGVRHRTEGLGHRLAHNTIALKLKKRTSAKSLANTSTGKMYDMRSKISQESHILFQRAKEMSSIDVFRSPIKTLTESYEPIYKQSRRSFKDKLSEAIEKRAPNIYKTITSILKKIRNSRN